ncbi:MAG: mechanosensitive ion channel domain-containing protein [Oceanospirillaceae bacterium]
MKLSYLIHPIYLFSSIVCFFLLIASPNASEASPESVTAEDPEIPTAELNLFLQTFSKAELLIEAEAWQKHVQTVAREIANAEITIQRENSEVKEEDNLSNKIREAKKKLESLLEATDQAQSAPDKKKVDDLQSNLQEIQETIIEIEAAVKKFAALHLKTAETAEMLSEETKAVIEEKKHESDGVQIGHKDTDNITTTIETIQDEEKEKLEELTGNSLDISAKKITGLKEIGQLQETLSLLDESLKIIQRAEKNTKAEKVELLETLTVLREKRTQFIDNFRAVIDELEAKTDGKDNDTLAVIADYRLLITGISGVHVDVTDTMSTWVMLKGWVTSKEGGKRWILNALRFLGILIGAYILAKLLSEMVRRTCKRMKLPMLLHNVLITTTSWLIMGIGLIWALSALEFSVAPLLAIVGAAGIVIAFAMQDSLSNFAAGFMILFFRPFDIDDSVDAGGVVGTVRSMNLVSTTIRTFDNKLMIVPNSKIWNEVITNATGVTQRRVDMVFGIGYDDDIDRAQSILEEIVTSHPLVLKMPEPNIKLNELADSSVNFICRPWVLTSDYWEVYWDVTKDVKKRFDKADIGIPYPQQDVHLHLADKQSDGLKLRTDD